MFIICFLKKKKKNKSFQKESNPASSVTWREPFHVTGTLGHSRENYSFFIKPLNKQTLLFFCCDFSACFILDMERSGRARVQMDNVWPVPTRSVFTTSRDSRARTEFQPHLNARVVSDVKVGTKKVVKA